MKFPIWTKVTFKTCPQLIWTVDWFDHDFENSRKVSVNMHWWNEDDLILAN
jgi:hypothetical protein